MKSSFIHPACIAVVLTNSETSESQRFPSINQAAKYLKADQPSVSRALKNGYKVHGHSVKAV